MKILAFDSSNQKSSVAIYEDERILSYSASTIPNNQAETLLSLIEQTLEKAGLSYSDLDFMAVTTGPGSFTGVRIGLAAAEGIAAASGVKTIGIGCLEVMNLRAIEHSRNYDYSIALMNAYRGQIYAQAFLPSGEAFCEAEMIDLEKVDSYLSQFAGKIVIVGSGMNLLDRELLIAPNVISLPRFPNPEARNLCRLAFKKASHGNYAAPFPLYIRLPDAKKQI
ncbi:MAG: tRNA (adenosine(37)-N6)-threonylcarbamoyltransferase complex dimerization subunit type 1 TsaB [Rickettsiaceae bacterium]|nr:tRNA (adenosine(37)-N6)-threonylcarbamoyltransferase complex dimerization subunit type 1 TsaB [Rickettsiaceae bacterium]